MTDDEYFLTMHGVDEKNKNHHYTWFLLVPMNMSPTKVIQEKIAELEKLKNLNSLIVDSITKLT